MNIEELEFMKICKRCGGKGTLTNDSYNSFLKKQLIDITVCPNCKGNGWMM